MYRIYKGFQLLLSMKDPFVSLVKSGEWTVYYCDPRVLA